MKSLEEKDDIMSEISLMFWYGFLSRLGYPIQWYGELRKARYCGVHERACIKHEVSTAGYFTCNLLLIKRYLKISSMKRVREIPYFDKLKHVYILKIEKSKSCRQNCPKVNCKIFVITLWQRFRSVFFSLLFYSLINSVF